MSDFEENLIIKKLFLDTFCFSMTSGLSLLQDYKLEKTNKQTKKQFTQFTIN